MTAKEVLRHAISDAIIERILHRRTSEWSPTERYLSRGEEIPDRLLPGRAIMRLSAVNRAALADLTTDDAQCRDSEALMCGSVERQGVMRHLFEEAKRMTREDLERQGKRVPW